MTTESVHIHDSAKVLANLIIASGDILIEGIVHGMCVCGGTARITATGELKGGIRASQLIIEAGAKLEGSIIEAPSNAIGTIDVDAAIRARPGTGPAAQIEFKPYIPNHELIEPSSHPDDPILLHPARPNQLRVVR